MLVGEVEIVVVLEGEEEAEADVQVCQMIRK
jgi:hypothetical protein